MAKLVKLFLIFGPVQDSIKVIKKYANPGQTIDESLMSTLCLPHIEFVEQPSPEPRFQTFLVTKEDGQVLYGSGLIVHDRYHEDARRYAAYCYTIITDTPFIHATKSLLQLIWENRCDDIIIRSVMNIPIPGRRKCLRIVSPMITTKTNNKNNLVSAIGNNDCLMKDTNTPKAQINLKAKLNIDNKSRTNLAHQQQANGQINFDQQQQAAPKSIDDIYLYRGMTPDLPLLDYPLRELFNFLHIDDFMLAYICILMEFRTLIISKDNYKLMMVGETLTSLLLPLKWCNVYVPILPPVYGATYLDAPTSYIMGINTQVTDLPDNLNHIQCRIYCDESRVDCDADSLTLPLFLYDIKEEILRVIAEYELTHANRPYTYLDDLKFNREIRIIFIKTIRKNILANYERYIVDVPESSSDIRQFDVVSYLSDQPPIMHSFLSKFLDTQLFVSFVDENAKRMQQSWLSIFDMDPDELSEHLSDKALEQAFQNAQRVHLMDLRQERPEIEVKTVPASPMKLRRRMPGLSAITSRLTFSKSASRSTSIECNSSVQTPPSAIGSSPPTHRNSVATVSLRGHLSLDPSLNPAAVAKSSLEMDQHQLNYNNNNNGNGNGNPTSLKPNHTLVSQSAPNGKIIELINEVRDLSKQILIEKLNDYHNNQHQHDHSTDMKRKISNNTTHLIGSLCDLIERVWSHGSFVSHQHQQQQDNTACCPLWYHLLAFTRIKLVDSRSVRRELSNGSHLNILPMRSNHTELDLALEESTNLFGTTINWLNNKLNQHRYAKISPLARDLIDDLKIIHTLRDVKTDVGKARAFIKLSLEKKKLSEHLKTLIDDQDLLEALYKPYAFLRCEEEREQFLTYLFTLQAVDLPCFTTTFVSVINTRRMNSHGSTTNLPAAIG